jgi:isoquinoline 1-oxidoreductase beta subunit
LKATDNGNVNEAFAAAGVKTLDRLSFPFLAHAPMEPLDAAFITADDGTVDVYSGSQFPGGDHMAAAHALDPSKVRLNTQLAGGSFGRRAQFGSPYMTEAAEVFKASGGKRPLKHMWTREDDLRGGFIGRCMCTG